MVKIWAKILNPHPSSPPPVASFYNSDNKRNGWLYNGYEHWGPIIERRVGGWLGGEKHWSKKRFISIIGDTSRPNYDAPTSVCKEEYTLVDGDMVIIIMEVAGLCANCEDGALVQGGVVSVCKDLSLPKTHYQLMTMIVYSHFINLRPRWDRSGWDRQFLVKMVKTMVKMGQIQTILITNLIQPKLPTTSHPNSCRLLMILLGIMG